MLKPSARIELIWQDASGDTAMTTLYLPNATPVETLDSAVSSVLPSVSALTGCSLIKVNFRYISAPFEPVLVTGTPITDTGVFFFTTGPTTPDGAIVVHAIDSSILDTEGPRAGYGISIDNPLVVDFADAVLSLPACNPFGDVFEALFVAYKQSRV